ncbi:hypothetical protein Tco_1337601 [Tanacetum coccineum]
MWKNWSHKKDCKGANVGNKANGSGTKGSVDGSSNLLQGHNMFNKSLQVYYVIYVSEANFVQNDDVAWWVDSRATVHVCKDRCWFKAYESLNDGSIIHMRNESIALVHERGCVDLKFNSGKIVSLFNVLHVPYIRKNLVSSSLLNNYGYKQVIESNKFVLSKHGLAMSTVRGCRICLKDGLFDPAFEVDTKKCKGTCMLANLTKKYHFQKLLNAKLKFEVDHSDYVILHATPYLGNKK